MSNTNVDPSPHIPLIHRVINQMGIPAYERDEAFSEGLVAITKAAQKFDPNRNVPLANWLGKNIRWSLQNWREEQRRIHDLEAPQAVSRVIVHDFRENGQGDFVGASLLGQISRLSASTVTSLENHLALREAFDNMAKILTPLERNVILLHAMDVPGIEIAKFLGIKTVAVSRTKNKAQLKLSKALK